MRRKNRFDTFKEAPNRGSYDDFPMLELGIDPQLHLSRNTVAQPFFLICEQDTVLAQLSGEARIEFRNSSVNYFNLALGDYVYIPGGTPHRILPKTESIQLRYKAEHPGLEAVAWYDDSGAEIERVTWDCADELPQEAYLRACTARDIDVSPFRWAEVAKEIRETEAAERARPPKDGVPPPKTPRRRNATAIAPASDEKPPLKNNVYLFARVATSSLNPLFPYTEPGAIVPCTTLQDPSDRGEMGYFIHSNTVHEVNVSFGARDSYQIPGGCAVGPFTHGVGQKAGQENSKMINLAVITQRQAVDEPQHEAFALTCAQCGEVLFRREYDAHAFPDVLDDEVDAHIIGLPTITQSAVTSAVFNADEHNRTCGKCGHVNSPFPAAYWGWDEYRRRTYLISLTRRIMRDAANAPAHA
ncbi:MAG TPA: hypothetical protein VN905_06035 [Candidatus Binatia bacterium]|nr:hypothetical protein [Candidatus Binatia bacterium]